MMMRQKKDKFKWQQHRTFIDSFIFVPAKIIRIGQHTEIKMDDKFKVISDVRNDVDEEVLGYNYVIGTQSFDPKYSLRRKMVWLKRQE